MTGKKLLNGYLDKLGRNIRALDVSIEKVRKPAKSEKPSDRRARLKLLRDLIELQNASMAAVKAHILGRDETGSVNEPDDIYDENPESEFERDFKRFLEPWTQNDIEFECEDCGVESEEVYSRTFSHPYPRKDEHFYLCEKCYKKRIQTTDAEPDQARPPVEPASKHEIETVLQSARLVIRTLKTLPVEQRISELERLLAERAQVAPGMEPAYAAYVGVLQKALDDAKAGKDPAGKPVTILPP